MNMEKPMEKKASPFELPEGLEFRAGDRIRRKDDPEQKYSIMGFVETRGTVRVRDSQGQPHDISPEDLKEYEHVPTGVLKELEDLVG
jgi:hypothetical protein